MNETAPETARASEAKPFKPALLAACDRMEKEWLCVEYWGQGTPAMAKENCDGYGGAIVAKCPAANALGRCFTEPGTISEQQVIWYGPRMTVEQAQAMCKQPTDQWKPF